MKQNIENYFSKVIKEKLTKKLYIIYAIVLVFLVYMLRRIGTAEVIEVLRGVNYLYLGIAGLLLIAAVLVRAYRLYMMLLKVKKVKWKNILLIQVLAQTIGVYTTGFAESVKTIPIKMAEDIPAKKTLEVFVLEKAFDMFAALFILVLAVPYIEHFFPSLAGQLFKLSVIGIAATIIAGVYVFEKKYKRIAYTYAAKVGLVTLANTALKLAAIYMTFLALGLGIDILLLFVIYATLTIVPFIAIVPFGLGVKEPVMILVAQATIGLAAISAFAILINALVFGSYTIMSICIMAYFARK